METIKQKVCEFNKINKDDLFVTRRGFFNEPKNVVIYLLRRLREEKLKDIGKEFEISKYSTVRSIIERTKIEALKNRDLKKHIEKLESELDKSQRQI